ncbi:universal stress protein [Pyrofollis japonicus]|uniref:universal stress protein n=1 Tax=Pyrofollis japonicus TaxID=3060460 RepID=UPI00295B2D21|nr:universal stress protein [Pyrofollis japonicus]BEP16911.1 universal stress protein [Pyrofollis japonicus]
MAYRKILVGYDGSEASKIAVRKAVDLAKQLGARITVATVLPPPVVFLGELMVPESVDISTLEEPAKKELEKLIAEIKETTGLSEADYAVLMGDPAEELVRYAEENGYDLIVVGRRGRGGIERLLLGSVSSKVVSISKNIDVLVVETSKK